MEGFFKVITAGGGTLFTEILRWARSQKNYRKGFSFRPYVVALVIAFVSITAQTRW